MNKQHVLQRRIIFGLLFLGGVTLSYASTEKDLGSSTSAITQQAVTVKGSVKDAAGEAIIGASVVVEGTTNGLITDVDGHFSIQASVGQNLVMSIPLLRSFESFSSKSPAKTWLNTSVFCFGLTGTVETSVCSLLSISA